MTRGLPPLAALLPVLAATVLAATSATAAPATPAVPPGPTPSVPTVTAPPPLCPATSRTTLYRTPRTYRRTVALTFDDGPSRFTPKFVAILKANGVHATFFETGAHVKAMPAYARATAAAGNKIGNHTYTHPQHVPGSSPMGPFITLPIAVQAQQIDDTTEEIVTATGRRPCFFRAPGGHDASSATHTLVRSRRMWTTNWAVSSGDSAQPGHRAASSYNKIYRAATTHPGDHPIILMHDGKASAEPEGKVSSYRGNTLTALPRIISWYKRHGYRFTDPAGHRF